MARGTKDRLDLLEERMDHVEHVIKRIDDLLNLYSQRLEDLSDGLRECHHLIEALTSEV